MVPGRPARRLGTIPQGVNMDNVDGRNLVRMRRSTALEIWDNKHLPDHRVESLPVLGAVMFLSNDADSALRWETVKLAAAILPNDPHDVEHVLAEHQLLRSNSGDAARRQEGLDMAAT